MSVQLPKRVTFADEILVQPLQNEAMMLDLNTGLYHAMDDIALRIWQLLSEQADVEKVAAQMQSEYDVAEDSLRHDMAALLDQWREAGLIHVEA